MKTLLAFLCVSAVAFAQEPSKKETPKLDKPIIVPFELLPSRHFVVKVKFEDKGPYRLILDTGAPLTIVNSKTAKAAGLTKKDSPGGILGLLGGGMNQVTVGKFEVGDALAEKCPAVVMDHPTVQAISEAFEKESGPIQGIVGFPFFARFAMTVDYQKKELTLTPNGYKPGDYMADLTKNLMAADKMNAPRVIAPATLWGFAVEKGAKDDDAGVNIKHLFDDSPAAKAGLKVGDRLLTIDGRWTDSLGDTLIAASLSKPGKAVPVVVKRDGKELTVNLTPAKGY